MKYNKLSLTFSILLISLNSLTSCSNSSSSNDVLRIYNWEDYIYLQDEEEGYTEIDLIDQFKQNIKETENRDITVIYDTFDTNESMLAQIKTGKVDYDLICPSDYTIQRMIQDDLLEKYDTGDDVTPNYDKYASSFLLDKLDNITIYEVDENGEYHTTNNIRDYCRGYFWGTLGIMYNPEYVTKEEVKDWNILWNEKFNNKISIKDSMRDTYAIGIMKAFDTEFSELKTRYENNLISQIEYNKEVSSLFNRSDDEAIQRVLDALLTLKENIFGFEVDSGKEDIQTGKIWINIAWSGDATYAMDQAESNQNPSYLEFYLPNTGANIWFDGWVMPKGANKDLAQKFVNFISDPKNASQNVDYTGYTSFISGYEVFDLIRSWYDVRYAETGELDDSIDISNNEFKLKDLTYFFGNDMVDENNVHVDPYMYIDEENLNRQLDTLYPDEEQLSYLAVMDDFPIEARSKILNMWEELKGTPLPLWSYIVLIIGVLLIIAYFIYRSYKNRIIKNQRKKLRDTYKNN